MILLDAPSSYLEYAMRVINDDYRKSQKLSEIRKVLRHAQLSIINECTTDCGENVGGTTAEPAAPEVAADDDGGDGDGDPDSDRQPQLRTRTPRAPRTTRTTSSALPPALSRPKAACALLGIGRTKLHQLSERDPRFPRKVVLGPRCVGWRTDALLDYLRLCEQEG